MKSLIVSIRSNKPFGNSWGQFRWATKLLIYSVVKWKLWSMIVRFSFGGWKRPKGKVAISTTGGRENMKGKIAQQAERAVRKSLWTLLSFHSVTMWVEDVDFYVPLYQEFHFNTRKKKCICKRITKLLYLIFFTFDQSRDIFIRINSFLEKILFFNEEVSCKEKMIIRQILDNKLSKTFLFC